MNKMLRKNFTWKILSLGIAVLLWVIVINGKDPLDTKRFNNIDVNRINEDVILNQNKHINVREGDKVSIIIKGKRKALDSLTIADIKAYVDMEQISVTGAVEIQIQIDDRFEVLKRTPSNLIVELENIISVDKNIQYIYEGETEEGYIVGDANIEPTLITLTGPESQINKISKVLVKINVDKVNKDMNFESIPKIYDSDEKEIQGLTKSNKNIKVFVPVNKIKSVPIKVDFEDDLQEDYIMTKYELNQTEVLITGKEDEIDSIEYIQIPDISMKDITGSTVIEYNLNDYMPQNIKLYNTGAMLKVSMNVEKEETKDVVIPVKDLIVRYIPEGLKFSYISTEDITITVKGLSNKLNNVTSLYLRPIVELESLEEGQHEVEIQMSLPEGVILVSQPPMIKVELSKDQEKQTEVTE